MDFDGLKKLGVVLKRAKYFITCKGKYMPRISIDNTGVIIGAIRDKGLPAPVESYEQTSLFTEVTREDRVKCLTGQI